MKPIWCMLVLAVASSAAHAATDAPGFERGRLLYENHCRYCHTPSIHSRAARLPLNRDELSAIVDHFRRTEGLAWTREEVDDVVEYLNGTRYRFAQ